MRLMPAIVLVSLCAVTAAGASLLNGHQARPQLYLGLGHASEITAVAWSPDGLTLASGGRDNSVILWDVATARPRATLWGHTSVIRQIGWSPDGNRLATSDEGGLGFLWEAASGRLRSPLEGIHGRIDQFAWSPDGRNLAGGRGDAEVVLWDGRTGKRRYVLKGVDGEALAWSPDSRTLATGKGWSGIAATLWDVATGRRRADLRGDLGYTGAMQWSPGGRYLTLAADDGGAVAVWDVVTGRHRDLVRRGKEPGDRSPFVWSPRGTRLVTPGKAGSLILWSPETGEQRAALPAHGEQVLSLAWSPDGGTLASSGDGETVLWNTRDWTPRATMETDDLPRWNPNGKILATCGFGGTALWDARNGHRLARLPTTTDIAWRPDGKLLAEAGRALTSIPLRDPWTGAIRAILRGHATPVRPAALAWSPDGAALAVGTGRWMERGARDEEIVSDGALVIWDMRTGQPRGAVSGLRDAVYGLAWQPKGKTLAWATERLHFGGHLYPFWYITKADVILWDTGRGTLQHPLANAVVGFSWSPDGTLLATGGHIPTPGVTLWDAMSWLPHGRLPPDVRSDTLLWSPDGRTLATSGPQPHYTLWDVATLTRRTTITPPPGSNHGIAWSEDSATIAVSAGDHTVTLHDAMTGLCRQTLVQRTSTPWDRAGHPFSLGDGMFLSWQPHGHTLAAASTRNGTLKLWDDRTGGLQQIVQLPTPGLVALAWRPDGRTLAAAGRDQKIYLWDCRARKQRAAWRASTGSITALAWSPAGRTLATGSEDGAVRLWSTAAGHELAAFYSLEGGKEWLVTTPAGYFAASAHGAEVIQWRQGGKLWPAAKFRRQFERPDLVRRALW